MLVSSGAGRSRHAGSRVAEGPSSSRDRQAGTDFRTECWIAGPAASSGMSVVRPGIVGLRYRIRTESLTVVSMNDTYGVLLVSVATQASALLPLASLCIGFSLVGAGSYIEALS